MTTLNTGHKSLDRTFYYIYTLFKSLKLLSLQKAGEMLDTGNKDITMKNNQFFPICLFLSFLLTSCGSYQTNSDSSASQAAANQLATQNAATLTPTSSPTLTLIPTNTATPSPTPSPTLPSVILTPLPNDLQTIGPENVDKLKELAHWGDGQLYALRLSIDGNKIIAILSSGVRVFDAKSLTLLTQVNTSIPDEYGINWAVSPDGEKLIVIDGKTGLMIWQLSDGKKLGSLHLDGREDMGCASDPKDYVFSTNSENLAIFGYCNGWAPASRFILIRINDLKVLIKLEGVGQGSFSPDGKYLVIFDWGSDKQPVQLWRVSDGELLHEWSSYTRMGCGITFYGSVRNPWPQLKLWGDELSCVAFSPDSQKLAVGFEDAVHIYNVSDGAEIGVASSGRPWFSADGEILWVETKYPHNKGYNSKSGKIINYLYEKMYPVLSSDGTHLTSLWSYKVGGLILGDINAGEDLARFPDYGSSTFSPDGTLVALSSGWGKSKPVIVVKTSNGEVIQTLSGESNPIFLPDNSLITISADELIVRGYPFSSIKYTIKGVFPQLLPDGESFITLQGNSINRWNAADGSLLATQEFPVSPENLTFVNNRLNEKSITGNRILVLPGLTFQQMFGVETIISPDGTVYAVSKTTSIEIWSADEHPRLLYSLQTDGHHQLMFSPDSKRLAIDRINGYIDIWNIENGVLQNSLLVGTSKKIAQMVFTPDNSHLFATIDPISRSTIYSLAGWNLPDGSPLTTRSTNCDPSITISADSELLAYCSEKAHLSGWGGDSGEKETGAEITVVQIKGWLPLKTFKDEKDRGISQLAFSPDARILAVTSPYGGIKIWDVEKATLLRTIVDNQLENYLLTSGTGTPKGQFGTSVGFSSDGKYLLRTADGVAHLWGIISDGQFVAPANPTSIPTSVAPNWDFKANGNTEGWEAWNQIANLQGDGGNLTGQTMGDDPFIASPMIAVDAITSPIIKIRMAVSTIFKGQVFFITSSDGNFDEGKSLFFDVIGDGEFHTYILDMSKIYSWKGTITRIRIDPPESSSLFIIDFVQIGNR